MADRYPDIYAPASNGSLNGSLNSNGSNTILSNVQNSASAAVDNISQWQPVQAIANGPAVEKARVEAENTKQEFGNLAASRQTPQTQTLNGQALTHYHSFFYNLLSWENPRATSITYAAIVSLIFVLRYVPVARYVLRAVYLLLGLTAAAEVVGKFAVGNGFASKMRPKRYYTIPRETLESILADVEELINFFVIEFQRIVFAENVSMTIGAFSTAFVTYWLIKFMPTWGIALFFTTVIFFTPLTYIQHKELIDEHIANAQNIANEQTSQIRDIATEQTNKVVEMSQIAFQEYSAKASELLGQTKKATVEKGIVSPETAEKVVPEKVLTSTEQPTSVTEQPVSIGETSTVKEEQFPTAPKSELTVTEPHVTTLQSDESASIKPEPLTAM